jgi:hypothetical protein
MKGDLEIFLCPACKKYFLAFFFLNIFLIVRDALSFAARMTTDACELCSEFLLCFGYPLDGLCTEMWQTEDSRPLQYGAVSLGA